MSETVDVDVDFIHQTDSAVLFDYGSGEVWIPRSVIVDKLEDYEGVESIELPEWFAMKEGLI